MMQYILLKEHAKFPIHLKCYIDDKMILQLMQYEVQFCHDIGGIGLRHFEDVELCA